jgi:hypothetical protein
MVGSIAVSEGKTYVILACVANVVTPLEISMAFSHTAPIWIFPGGDYFCLGYLLSDES